MRRVVRLAAVPALSAAAVVCVSLGGCVNESATPIGNGQHVITINFPAWTKSEAMEQDLREVAERTCPNYYIVSKDIVPWSGFMAGHLEGNHITAVIDCSGNVATSHTLASAAEATATPGQAASATQSAAAVTPSPHVAAPSPPQEPILLSNSELRRRADEWKARNPWFNPKRGDPASLAALQFDDQIAKEGFNPKTDAYWNELDRRMAAWSRAFEANAQARAAAIAAAEQQRAAMLRFSAGMLAPTRTGSFGESLGNGFGAAAGMSVPSGPSCAPVQMCDTSGQCSVQWMCP